MQPAFYCDFLHSIIVSKTDHGLFLLHYFSVRASSPGRTLPSRSSIEAPPPVEIHENLSARPRLIAAAAESPPPMIDFTPY